MGANCSNNLYDPRPWTGLENGDGTGTTKPRNHGLHFRRRAQSDPTCDTHHLLSGGCTCNQQGINCTDSKPAISALILPPVSTTKLNSDHKNYLLPNDVADPAGAQVPRNKPSPKVNNSGHLKLSRILGSGRARATVKCDVSPHRLLTRRNNSPLYRTPGITSRSINSSQSLYRQRAQSWSNDKLWTKDNLKGNSCRINPSCSCYTENSIPSVVKHCSKHSQTNSSTLEVPCGTVKSTRTDNHDHECPLHIKSKSLPRISVSEKSSVGVDEEWIPIARPRAASESHTIGAHRHLLGISGSAELNHSNDHAHVHWADEEKGSSLSTSVFLSSVRPRSYSNGAVDTLPHRPILKKITVW